MFLVFLNVLFSIFMISLLIYLSNLKERFPELAQIGWNKLTAGLTLLLLAGITGTLSSLSLGSTIFSSVQVSYFLQIGFLVLGIGWIFWGLAKWLAFIQQKREEFQNRQNELDYIRRSLAESQKGNSLVEILEASLKNATSHFGNQQAAVWITNPVSSELVLASYRGLSPNLGKSLEKLSSQEGIAKQVCSGEIYFTSQIKTGADSFINALSAEGIQSVILLPITIRQSRIGMLGLFSEQKFKFEPAAAALLTEALSHLGDRIEFLRLNRELRKKSETLNQSIAENRILSVLSGYLSSDLGLEPILDKILWEGLKVINASVGHIFLMEGSQVEVKATLEPSMVRVKGVLSEFPLINRAVTSRSVVTEGSHLLVPIFRAGKISGVIWYENKEVGSTFSTREVEQAKTLTHQASLAIAHWQLQQSASQAAEKIVELSSKLDLLQLKYDELSAKQPEPVSEIETLLASQVNDINNLLAGVLGNVELLQEKLDSGQMPYNQNLVESLKSIENTTLDAAALLRKFSQRETVEVIPSAEPVKIEVEREEAPPSKGLRILAIDDQKMILDLLESMLSTLGHKTEVAESGEEGLRKFGSDSFDLVITDLGMPDISGFEVSQKIKQIRPEVPIVLITGWGANFEEAQLKEAGVDYLLAKPFRLEQLTEVVEKAFANRMKS